MQDVVSHMPMSPWSDPELGYYSQPIHANAISEVAQVPYVFTTNIVGTKTNHQGDVSDQLKYLDRLGISSEDTWVDADEVNSRYIENILNRGILEGWIEKQKKETFLCPCGKTEFVNTYENVHPSQERTTYKVEGDRVVCKLCDENAILGERDVLIMKIPQLSLPYVDIYPNYAKSEIEQHLKFFKGKEYLLSRSTPRPICASIGDENYYIDTDISWLPFVYSMQEKQKRKIEILLTGNRTLKQTALAMLVNSMLGASLPSKIISTPRVDIDFGEKSRLKAQAFLESNGTNVTRVFIGQALGTDQKSIILKSKGAFWIAKSLEKYTKEIFTPSANCEINQFLNPSNKTVLDNILKKLRTNEVNKLTNYEKTLLWALMAK